MDDRPAIAVDLDGTILSYDPPAYPGLGEPLPGVIEALTALRDIGYRIIVHTCRLRGAPEEVGAEAARIAAHLTERGVPFDELFLPGAGKPMAEWYIDDKAVAFRGDWDEVLEEIVEADISRMASRVASAFLTEFEKDLKSRENKKTAGARVAADWAVRFVDDAIGSIRELETRALPAFDPFDALVYKDMLVAKKRIASVQKSLAVLRRLMDRAHLGSFR